jgi:hypothetical protein
MAGKKHQKVQDTTIRLSRKHGNGVLRREVWIDDKGKVVRYNLAYINHEEFQGDNGRVIGYDNAHGHHHRHVRGKVEAVEFSGFEDIESRFQTDWLAFKQRRKK